MFISTESYGYGEVKNVFLSSVQKPHLPVWDCNRPHPKEARLGPRMESWRNPSLPFAVVPCLHQTSVCNKRKQQVWRVQKCILLDSAKTSLTCAGLQTTCLMKVSIGPRMEFCGNPGLVSATVPCLHQSNVYIKRKIPVWRVQICLPLVGAKTALTCAGRQTTPSHVSQYSSENGNLRKSGSTFRYGTVFAPEQCLYQK